MKPIDSEARGGTDNGRRKALDDIRRELEAAYPSTPDDGSGEPVAQAARPRSGSRRATGRRGYLVAAGLGGLAGALLFVAFGAVTTRNVDPRGLEPSGQPSAAVPSPAATPRIERQLDELRAELQALAARLERSESRLVGVESRIKGGESVRRPARVTPPDVRRSRPEPSPRPVPAESFHPSTVAADDGPSREASAPKNAPPTSAAPTVGDRVREEWRTIKHSLGSLGQDLKATMRSLTGTARGADGPRD